MSSLHSWKQGRGRKFHVVYMLQIYVLNAHEQKSYIGIHYLYFKKNVPYRFKHISERVLIMFASEWEDIN